MVLPQVLVLSPDDLSNIFTTPWAGNLLNHYCGAMHRTPFVLNKANAPMQWSHIHVFWKFWQRFRIRDSHSDVCTQFNLYQPMGDIVNYGSTANLRVSSRRWAGSSLWRKALVVILYERADYSEKSTLTPIFIKLVLSVGIGHSLYYSNIKHSRRIARVRYISIIM